MESFLGNGPLRKFGVAADDHQTIIEIVCNSSRKLTHCLHLLRLPELLLQFTTFAQVGDSHQLLGSVFQTRHRQGMLYLRPLNRSRPPVESDTRFRKTQTGVTAQSGKHSKHDPDLQGEVGFSNPLHRVPWLSPDTRSVPRSSRYAMPFHFRCLNPR